MRAPCSSTPGPSSSPPPTGARSRWPAWREEFSHPAHDHALGGPGRGPRRGRGGRRHAQRAARARRRSPACGPASTSWSRSPWRRTLAEAEAMRDAARASDAFLMVAHCWRFHEDVRRMRDRIAAGELGEVVKTRGYGVHAKWGPSGLVHRPRAGRGRRAAGHGRPRHRHRPVPAGRPAAPAGPRRGRPPLRRLRGRRRRDPADHLGQRDQLDRGVRAGGSRTWPAWRPTPRSTAPAATTASGPSPRGRRGTSTARSPCTRRRWPSSWTRIAQGRQPLPSGEDGLVVMRVVDEAAYRAAGGWAPTT